MSFLICRRVVSGGRRVYINMKLTLHRRWLVWRLPLFLYICKFQTYTIHSFITIIIIAELIGPKFALRGLGVS